MVWGVDLGDFRGILGVWGVFALSVVLLVDSRASADLGCFELDVVSICMEGFVGTGRDLGFAGLNWWMCFYGICIWCSLGVSFVGLFVCFAELGFVDL